MSHRTQITLTDAQYKQLKERSMRTGVGIAELIRQALAGSATIASPGDAADALARTSGAWSRRDYDGRQYVERTRRGLGRKLRP
jgi:Ribbon-helix-helix domain